MKKFNNNTDIESNNKNTFFTLPWELLTKSYQCFWFQHLHLWKTTLNLIMIYYDLL